MNNMSQPQSQALLPLLRSLPFLGDLEDQAIRAVAEGCQLVRYEMGQALTRLEAFPEHALLVMQGRVRMLAMSQNLPKGVATLQQLESGSLLGWSPLSCGHNWETAIASTEVVALAIPHDSMRNAMVAAPAFRERVERSVSPSELFGVLNIYLQDYPRGIDKNVVHAARDLAETCLVKHWKATSQAEELSADHCWLTASPGTDLGRRVVGQEPERDGDIRLLGIPSQALSGRIDEIGDGRQDLWQETTGETKQTETAPSETISLQSWQSHVDQYREEQVLADAPALVEAENEPESYEQLDAASFPHYSGNGVCESSCAAFHMLCDHLRLPYRKELFKRIFSDQEQRHAITSLALCGAVAESIGLQTQLLEVTTETLLKLESPLMIGWGNGVALVYRCNRKGIVLGIPAAKNTLLSQEEFIEQWGEEGEVLTLKVNALTPKRKFGVKWFLPALKQHRAVLIEVLIASFFVQLLGLVNPLLIQQVIDKAIINSSPDALGVLGLLLVVFALFEGLLLTLRTLLFVDTTNRIDISLGSNIIDHLLRLPLSYFDRRPVGEVSSRIAELEKIRGFLTGTALTVILDACFSVVYIVVMFIYSWKLALLTLAMVPVLAVITLTAAPIVQQQLQKRAVANSRTQSHLVEVLSSMQTVKAQNIELRTRWKWQELYTDYVAEGFDNTLTSSLTNNLSGFLNKLSSLLVIWAGAYLVLSGELTLGGMIAFRIISGYVTGPLLRMSSIWQSVQETNLSLERLSDVIDQPSEATEDNSRKIVMPPIEGAISFKGIHFRYKPSSPLLLTDVDLEIPKGAFVGIVGTSGSGKSTLTKLVARLYEAERGSVLIDGIDIQKVELYSLRRQVGIVPQDTVLFDGSIEENIALTRPEASSEEVMEAARIACAHDFIMSLPGGYAQQVGERGSNLSGGQRQRIAIARTILQEPKMLIMDEATSALDFQTERTVSNNLMRSLKNRTVLFITHRLSSIESADMIVCMGNGQVLEIGTHDDLIAARGAYYALWRQQGKRSNDESELIGLGAQASS
jgi:ATP-binding cassette subfamily B protein